MQLCHQVQHSLNFALSSVGDPVLGELFVESVLPAPDAGHLLVTVSPLNPSRSLTEILQHLHSAAGRIRAEVAADISRRRVPELTFCCVPPEEAPSRKPLPPDEIVEQHDEADEDDENDDEIDD